MYGLPGEIVRPGCSLRDLLECRKATGSLALDVETYLQKIDQLLETGETSENAAAEPAPPAKAAAKPAVKKTPPIGR